MLTLFRQFTPHIVAYFSDKSEGNMSRRWGSSPEVRNRREVWLKKNNIDPTRTIHVNPENGFRTVCFSTISDVYEGIASERPVLKGDAVFTDMSHLFLTLPVADCALLFVYEAQKGIVGLIHAGWHGLNQRIVVHALETMKHTWDIDLSQTYIEVSPYFHRFRKLCEDVSYETLRFWAEHNLVSDRGQEYRFNIAAMIRKQVEQVGEVSYLSFAQAEDTFTNNRFYSHREWVHGTNESGRQMGVIGKIR